MSWQPIETVPRTGDAVLVYLEEPMLRSKVQAATYHPNVTCIGGCFEFDAPKALFWMPLPAPPEGETP